VAKVDRRADSAFARISLSPLANPDSTRHVLLLEPESAKLPERPEGAAAASSAPDASRKGKHHAAKAASGVRP
jgi:rod shape-determining protein MreC